MNVKIILPPGFKNDPKTNAKTYWSILKTFYNGKKVLIIPPLLINNKLISDFKLKANYFNDFLHPIVCP